MRTAILASAIALLSIQAGALPASSPDGAISGGADTASPGKLSQVINPTAVVNVFEDHPDTAFGVTSAAKVAREGNKHNVQALVKFDIPDSLAGSLCELTFVRPSKFSGNQLVSVHNVTNNITIANIENATYETRPLGGVLMGNFKIRNSNVVDVINGLGLGFDCPAAAQGALVFVVDSVGIDNLIEWDASSAGLVINVYPRQAHDSEGNILRV